MSSKPLTPARGPAVRFARALSALLLALPLVAGAQGPAAGGPPAGGPPMGGPPGAGNPMGEMPPELMEAMQIQMKLRAAVEKSLGDPAIAAQRSALMAEVQAAMVAADPTSKTKLERLEALSKQAETLQKANDQAGLQKLMMEGRELASGLQALEKTALENAGLRAKAEALDVAVKTKVKTVEPEFEKLEARLTELSKKLQGPMGGGGGGPRMPPPGGAH
jgi:hypothetical protein